MVSRLPCMPAATTVPMPHVRWGAKTLACILFCGLDLAHVRNAGNEVPLDVQASLMSAPRLTTSPIP